MTPTRTTCCLAVAALLAGCSSAPRGEMDPAIEEAAARRRAEAEQLGRRQQDFDKVLLDLDKTMDKYVEAVVKSDYKRAEQRAQGLDTYLRKTVAQHFDDLVRASDDQADPSYRAKAIAALGFSGRPEALDPLLNAMRSDDPVVVNNAAFGLGVLKDPRTPPQLLSDLVENEQVPDNTRRGAAWSLFQLQGALHDPARVYPVWLRLLAEPEGDVPPWILVQALRGLSRSRDPQHAAVVEPFAAHPTPLVRQATAICLGYLRNRDSHRVLLTMISPAETNPNVRLAARKALQALAGNIDRGYDVEGWRKVFESRREG